VITPAFQSPTLPFLTVVADPSRTEHPFDEEAAVFDSDDVVFAWAILKALLVVVVGFGFLIYATWAVIRQSKDAAQRNN
jgi:hypothetical protein